MKEFWYDDLEDYFKMADSYDNPKTVKVFEVCATATLGRKLFRVITYLRTALIGWHKEVGNGEVEELVKKCKLHGHSPARIIEVGRIE